MNPTRAASAAALLAAMLAAGCGHHKHNELGPPIPTGATVIGGPDMTSAPPPPPGWTLRPVTPASQQQAQDTVLGYLKKTLRALPPGTTVDATRFSGGTNTPPCKDVETGIPPVSFSTIGELKLPPGISPDVTIEKVGDIWKSWGWYVIERDGFYKPNRFGYGPDGYSLKIMASSQAGYPPTLEAISACFPGNLPDDRSPFPTILKAD
ncbi:hypothetical protein MXEN_01040 [Mycobacterium xenopi RIVM700367]|nr:hypothetical protein MXEN_01040 [Mycobacterium xenopi RIVM700367]EUA35794.1 hypothetical protein I552_6596 [Mycobacterium xenopi 3993]ORX21045.1 hypothetical protein AWC32_02415 [Mycobacterium xenopi]